MKRVNHLFDMYCNYQCRIAREHPNDFTMFPMYLILKNKSIIKYYLYEFLIGTVIICHVGSLFL